MVIPVKEMLGCMVEQAMVLSSNKSFPSSIVHEKNDLKAQGIAEENAPSGLSRT
jgi:hypothetical protein